MSAKAEIDSLAEWRQNPQLVGEAFKTFSRPWWKLLMRIMQENEHIRLHDSNIAKSSDQKLGQIEGWDLYHGVLKTAALPLQTQGEMPDATFATPEVPAKLDEEKE